MREHAALWLAPLNGGVYRRLVVGVEISDQILDLLLVLDPGERDLGARHLCFRILDLFRKRYFIPGDSRILFAVRVAVALNGAGLAAEQTVEHRTFLHSCQARYLPE